MPRLQSKQYTIQNLHVRTEQQNADKSTCSKTGLRVFNYRHRKMEEEVINHVRSYKYLGITQFITPWRTSQKKGKEMVERAKTDKNGPGLSSWITQ